MTKKPRSARQALNPTPEIPFTTFPECSSFSLMMRMRRRIMLALTELAVSRTVLEENPRI